MEYVSNKLKDYLVEYEIKLTQEEVKSKKHEIIKDIQKSQMIPGYRKGKAPEGIIVLRYKEYIEEDIQKKILQGLYKKITKEEKKDPLHFTIKEYDLEKGICKYEVEFLPVLDINDHKGIEIEEAKFQEKEEDVLNEYAHILTNFATWEDYKGKVGEDVLVNLADYVEEIEGEKPTKMDKFPVIYSEKKDPKPFYSKVKEVEIGKEYTYSISYGSEGGEKYRGKTVKYSYKVESLKKRKMPKENEELFSKIFKDSKTKEDVIKKLRGNITKNSEIKIKQESLEKIYDILIERHPFELPPNYLEQMKEEIYRAEDEKYKKNYGVGMEKFNITKESMSDKIVRGIKMNYIRRHLIDKEKLEITEEELTNTYKKIAIESNISHEGVKSFYDSNKEYINNLKNDLLTQKIDDLLYENAKIKKIKLKREKENKDGKKEN
jgi:trigger factor